MPSDGFRPTKQDSCATKDIQGSSGLSGYSQGLSQSLSDPPCGNQPLREEPGPLAPVRGQTCDLRLTEALSACSHLDYTEKQRVSRCHEGSCFILGGHPDCHPLSPQATPKEPKPRGPASFPSEVLSWGLPLQPRTALGKQAAPHRPSTGPATYQRPLKGKHGCRPRLLQRLHAAAPAAAAERIRLAVLQVEFPAKQRGVLPALALCLRLPVLRGENRTDSGTARRPSGRPWAGLLQRPSRLPSTIPDPLHTSALQVGTAGKATWRRGALSSRIGVRKSGGEKTPRAVGIRGAREGR